MERCQSLYEKVGFDEDVSALVRNHQWCVELLSNIWMSGYRSLSRVNRASIDAQILSQLASKVLS